MEYTLKKVDEHNWREIAALTVAANQKEFIEPNEECLLEASYDKTLHWTPLGLYVKNKAVGFAMVGAYNQNKRSAWLDRFMIDQYYQGQGLGKHFLPLIIQYLFEHYDIDKIYLSAHKENTDIFAYYEAFGFKDTQQLDPNSGEKIMVYQKKNT